MPVPDENLVERARRGDRDAFDLLVSRHLSRVWGLVWRTLRHREDTEDVVQETFLTAYRSLPDFRGESSFSTWLSRIAITRALNHLDRSAEKIRRASGPLEERHGLPGRGAAANPGPLAPAAVATPLQELEARELRRRLAECLSRLPAAWRAILALRESESLAYEEIAGMLGIAVGTVRSRLARARLALRACVRGEEP